MREALGNSQLIPTLDDRRNKLNHMDIFNLPTGFSIDYESVCSSVKAGEALSLLGTIFSFLHCGESHHKFFEEWVLG